MTKRTPYSSLLTGNKNLVMIHKFTRSTPSTIASISMVQDLRVCSSRTTQLTAREAGETIDKKRLRAQSLSDFLSNLIDHLSHVQSYRIVFTTNGATIARGYRRHRTGCEIE